MRNDINGSGTSDVGGSTQAKPSEDCLAVQDETQAVLTCLAEEFGKQLHYAHRELNQTQELLNDAINTLIACVTSIHRSVDAITGGVRRTAAESQASGKPTSPAVKTVLNISDQLEANINTAIRTLQFQDITTQLIDHAIHRVSAMNDTLADIKSLSAKAPVDSNGFIDQLCRQKESILHKVANLDEHKTNPVSQGHMGTGEIELF